MNLSRGTCILCTNNKIIVPPQAEDITFLLKDVLADQIDCKKFDEINSSLKVCPMCIHDLITVANHKQNIKGRFLKNSDNCALCYSETHLVSIKDWKYFDKILENVISEKRRANCFACFNCIKCLDLLERIKTNLFKKHPNLELSDFFKASPITKDNLQKGERLSKFISDESECLPHSRTKNVNNLKAALKHLKPLKNTRFNIDKFKQDKKLLKQIAFVKLSVSNLSTKDYKRLKDRSKSPERSKRSVNLSDTDSSRDSPSPKHSFFKIRLKINPNKVKSQRISHGKVTKPKSHKNKPISENKKQLVVKIMKMNFDKLTALENRTPTKASRKMLPEESISGSKKRKSVTFADVLDTEIIDGSSSKDNADETRLKSLLKKSISPKLSQFKNDSDESDDENNEEKQEEPNPSSDEEEVTPKSYVDNILRNNDKIFDSLKTPESKEVMPAKVKEHRRSSSIDSNSSDGEVKEKCKLGSNNMKRSKNSKKKEDIEKLEINKMKKNKIIEVKDCNSGNKEEQLESEEETSNENEKQEENEAISTEHQKNKRKKLIVHNDSDDNESENEKLEEHMVITTEFKDNKKITRIVSHNGSDDNDSEDGNIESRNEEEEDIANVEYQGNKLDISNRTKNIPEVSIDNAHIVSKNNEKSNTSELDKDDKKKYAQSFKKSHKSGSKKNNEKHRKRKRSNSTSDSNLEENIANKETKELSKNKDQQSTENGEIVRSDVEGEISLSKCFQDIKKSNGSETSMEDKEITLEEFKTLRKTNLGEDAPSEEIKDDEDNLNEDSNSGNSVLNDGETTDNINSQDSKDLAEDNVDKEVSVTERENQDKQTDKISLDIESESEKSVNSNGSYDSSNFGSKSKKRPKRTIERQEEEDEAFNISREDEDSEEPETKKEKVSEVDDLSKTDSKKDINASETKKKDVSSEVAEKQKAVDAVDSKIDELITKYANPSIPNLNNDNVSDSQNAGASGEDQGTETEVPSRRSEVNLNKKVKKGILKKSSKYVDDTVLVENNSESDITKNNSDVQDKTNVISGELDMDNIFENVVDSC